MKQIIFIAFFLLFAAIAGIYQIQNSQVDTDVTAKTTKVGVLINGSYVTSKVDPRDIDISPVIDGTDFGVLPLDHQDAVEHLIDHNSRLPQILRCHPFYTVFVYPKGHRLRRVNNETLRNGKAFWSRAKGGREKGFLFLKLETE